jgi:hypothetical protein
VFTARYALSPYIKQIRFAFKGLITRRYCMRPACLQNADVGGPPPPNFNFQSLDRSSLNFVWTLYHQRKPQCLAVPKWKHAEARTGISVVSNVMWWWCRRSFKKQTKPGIISNNIARISKNQLMSIKNNLHFTFFSNGATAPSGPGPPQCRGFTFTLRHTTLGRTPLDEWSARRRDFYLTRHNTQKRQTSMQPGGIRTPNTNKRAATDPRLRPRGHWDRHLHLIQRTYKQLHVSASN